MRKTATSVRKHRDPASAGASHAAPPSGRSSIGRSRTTWAKATAIALLPAVLGIAVEILLAGYSGWALAIVAAAVATAWTLARHEHASFHLERTQWAFVAMVSLTTIVIVAPAAAGWMLLPVVPALLLHLACRNGQTPRVCPMIRVFSAAALTAIIVQIAQTAPSVGGVVAAIGAAVLGLFAIEPLVARPWSSKCGGEPPASTGRAK